MFARTIVIAAAIVVATATPAVAAPVPDRPITPGDCGPGLADTVFTLNGPVTTCRTEYLPRLVPKDSIRPGWDAWWNPWSWGR